MSFGPHLTLDLYGCSKKKLQDISFVYSLLDELPRQIGMTRIMPPYVFAYSGLKPEDAGVSGIVLIAESHISVHTFQEKGYAAMDIFSCNQFDQTNATNIIVSKLGAKTYEQNIFNRGRHFPKSIARNKEILELTRQQKT